MKIKKQILFVIGVSGSGKTTIGILLAKKTGFPFFDGDDYHPQSNVEKMTQGHPLNDEDRKGWLQQLNELAKEKETEGAVIACSALKTQYREQLRKHLEHVIFIFLEGSFQLIFDRLNDRKDHFMPPNLLQSQFDALEIPKHAISVSIDASPQEISNTIYKKLS